MDFSNTPKGLQERNLTTMNQATAGSGGEVTACLGQMGSENVERMGKW
jgi:hypothetical protein